MARITGASDERVFSISRWLGLNENPDGDTKLKLGEAAEMRNFRVTRDGNLQKRPGRRAVLTVESGTRIKAVWRGTIAGTERVMAVCGGKLYSLWNAATAQWSKTEIGALGTVSHALLFGFSDKLYIITGHEYYVYDGSALSVVSGYVPLVAVTLAPDGSNELLEQVNKLTAKRRVWLSPDGTGTTFQLPEKGLASIDGATLTADGSPVALDSISTTDGTVTFSPAPAAGTNTIEVSYTASADFREEIVAMRFAEFYNGAQDTRVFLYGDGSNRALYSDIEYNDTDGSAEYFPDLNEVRVGVENTPITGMIRHFGSLAAFKSDSAYSINYGTVRLADGSDTAAFYVTPTNRAIGNEAAGQTRLVLNNPVTLYGQDVYEWRNSNHYTTGLSRDERQAQRVSDRVYSTMHSFDTKSCVTFDDNYNQEYYISAADGRALVWNYAANAWYLYTGFPLSCPFSLGNELYTGEVDGRIYHISTQYRGDGGESDETASPIFCWWESGSMSFGQDFKRKFSAMLWVGIKPEGRASVDVTARTDRTDSLAQKSIQYDVGSSLDFEHLNFEAIDFDPNDRAQMKRLKLKAKKFVYYKLIFRTNTNDTGVTVTATDIRVRFSGNAK